MTHLNPPRIAEWLVRVSAGDEEADHVLGDLREEYALRADTLGAPRARAWY